MPKLPRIEVAPRKEGGWTVKRSDDPVALEFPTKDAAVREAKRIAEHIGGATVKIKGKNGRIQEERTYPRSADPKRTKG